ncbi:MAG: NusA-like transcription termination signal-binding factor [Thermoprotei archaeon]|nr:NusA-like transcription termination signal-binding factor [Thermoprotei archaeon]
MPSIRLTAEEMRYISLFESITGASARDCVYDSQLNRLIFLVRPGEVGLAVGRNGIKVKQLRKLLGKNIEVVEYAETPEKLITNSLFPAKIRNVRITKTNDGRKIAIVLVDPSHKGLAIGKDGRNISRARILARRYFDIDNVVIP